LDTPSVAEVVVYSKPDCCLCDEVKAQLRRLQQTLPFQWREVNILDDPAAYEEYKEQIPVIFIDGKKAYKYHIDENDFVRRLQRSGH